MKVIVCIDDNNGIKFMDKRVSYDRYILEDIKLMINNSILIASDYSSKLFKDMNINIDNTLLLKQTEYYQFIEDDTLEEYENKLEEIVIYYFNRKYPSTLKLKVDLNKYDIISTYEFKGYSHEKIVKKVYKRKID